MAALINNLNPPTDVRFSDLVAGQVFSVGANLYYKLAAVGYTATGYPLSSLNLNTKLLEQIADATVVVPIEAVIDEVIV